MESSLSSTTIVDITKCIQVGLLCVEENIMDHPTMSSVISFLANENVASLPTPKKPAVATGRRPIPTLQNALSPKEIVSLNDLTITTLGQGR
jgi:hypothetical protein